MSIPESNYTDEHILGLIRRFEALEQFTTYRRKPSEEKALVAELDRVYLASLGRMTTDRKIQMAIDAIIKDLKAEKGSHKQHGIRLSQMALDLHLAAKNGRCGDAAQSVVMADKLVEVAEWLFEHIN